MFLSAGIQTHFQYVNLNLVSGIGIYDDTGGKYFSVNFNLISGSQITWTYDNKQKRDDKVSEAVSLLNKK